MVTGNRENFVLSQPLVRRFIDLCGPSKQVGVDQTGADSSYSSGFESIEDLASHLRGLPRYETIRANGKPDSKGFMLLQRKIKIAHPAGNFSILNKVYIHCHTRFLHKNAFYIKILALTESLLTSGEAESGLSFEL